jgi:phosphatidylinositol-4,5-bisphosphate 3-kinase
MFRNASLLAAESARTMFKARDDLRQGQLMLPVTKVMEFLWRKNRADLHTRCYGVLPTGLEQGFLEVVPNAVTEIELQKERGTITDV